MFATAVMTEEPVVEMTFLQRHVIAWTILLFLFAPNFSSVEVMTKVDGLAGKRMIESLFPHTNLLIDEIDNLEFIVYDIPKDQNGLHATYAVNPWTGDVWDMWVCKRITSPYIVKQQSEIKERFTVSEMAQYENLHQMRPQNVWLVPCNGG